MTRRDSGSWRSSARPSPRSKASRAKKTEPPSPEGGSCCSGQPCAYGQPCLQPTGPLFLIAAFTQFIWTSQSRPPTLMFAVAPLAAGYVVPNCQAHLSAFSAPVASYHASRFSSVVVSSVSCEIRFTSASAAMSSLGDPLSAEQAPG